MSTSASIIIATVQKVQSGGHMEELQNTLSAISSGYGVSAKTF